MSLQTTCGIAELCRALLPKLRPIQAKKSLNSYKHVYNTGVWWCVLRLSQNLSSSGEPTKLVGKTVHPSRQDPPNVPTQSAQPPLCINPRKNRHISPNKNACRSTKGVQQGLPSTFVSFQGIFHQKLASLGFWNLFESLFLCQSEVLSLQHLLIFVSSPQNNFAFRVYFTVMSSGMVSTCRGLRHFSLYLVVHH